MLFLANRIVLIKRLCRLRNLFKSFLLCIIYLYFKQQSEKIIRTYIWKIFVWNEIQSSQWYERIRVVDKIWSYHQQKICFINIFLRTLKKNYLSEKKKKPTKYNVFRIIFLVRHTRKYLYFMCFRVDWIAFKFFLKKIGF